MSERLFIRLGNTAEQACSWLVWSEQEQEIIASGELADAQSLASLTERAGNRPVDVLVPAASMMLTQVSLPEKGQRQAMKAIPFMLEDSLATNVDEMHVVVGPREGEALNVVAVAHEQMQMWLSWLQDAGLKVKNIVPDCLALPLAQCQWAILNMGREYLVRTGVGAGVSLPTDWADIALPQLTAKYSEQEQPLTIASYSSDMTVTGATVEQQPLDIPMLVLAKGLLDAPINLLDGVYKPKREYSKHLTLWRNSAIIFTVVLVLALVNKGLAINELNAQTAALHTQTERVFKQAVPGVNRIVNVRSQIDAQLRTLKGQGGGAEFFTMLNALRPAFSQVPALKPDSVRFDAKRSELRMQVTAKTYAQIDKFKEIISQDFKMEGGAMNNNDDKVTSNITLRSK
ncbi:type II secretion system protein GspL [Shewanella intestini]|uniref:Type II secretion system protein L n=1 Tax=Shewanella intestini TaxID=2017544 RepID=A0ABS5I5Q2_9GAMM|nr:type II secretion system protein GspL [Shewanella sp. XMDDZSB0408]MBR9729353.1 type II secretion system protein GspL [Shewanella intestini]MRG37432.1 type II secretion system protein GspL [Shewanella sp. XMDDZSB0408]